MVSGFCFFRNERKLFPVTIPSWLPFLDELVLVDTGSDDGSLELALELTAAEPRVRVVAARAEWPDPMDWAKITNRCMALCTEPWALRLDADEGLEGCPSAFRSLMRNYEALCWVQASITPAAVAGVLPVAVGGLLVHLVEPETGYSCYRSRLHRHIDGWRYHYRLDPVPMPPEGSEGGVFSMIQAWIIQTVHLRSSARADSLERAKGVLELAERLDGPLDTLARHHYQEAIDRAEMYKETAK